MPFLPPMNGSKVMGGEDVECAAGYLGRASALQDSRMPQETTSALHS